MYYSYFDPLNMIFHTLSWIAFIVLIVWLFRGSRYHRHMRMKDMHDMWKGDKALDILKERYAKGEINKEEFEEKKKTITS